MMPTAISSGQGAESSERKRPSVTVNVTRVSSMNPGCDQYTITATNP